MCGDYGSPWQLKLEMNSIEYELLSRASLGAGSCKIASRVKAPRLFTDYAHYVRPARAIQHLDRFIITTFVPSMPSGPANFPHVAAATRVTRQPPEIMRDDVIDIWRVSFCIVLEERNKRAHTGAQSI